MRVETGSRIAIGDVCDDVAGLESGVAFMLFVDDGLIGTLESHVGGDYELSENVW